MRKLRRELNSLRYDIQREKANFRAIERQLKRCYGEEVKEAYYVDPERDIQRIKEEVFPDPYDETALEICLTLSQAELDEYRNRVTYLKYRIDTELPLTPWGFAYHLIRACIRARRLKQR